MGTVRSLFLPKVENEGDMKKMEVAGQRPRFHEAWYGLDPALIISDLEDARDLKARWERSWEAWVDRAGGKIKSGAYAIVLRDLFEQEKTDKKDLNQIEYVTRVVNGVTADETTTGETRSVRAWPPVSLHYVLGKCAESANPLVPDARDASCFLDGLKTQQLESGRCWELVVITALVLRVHHLVLYGARRKEDFEFEYVDYTVEEKPRKWVSILPDGLVQHLLSVDTSLRGLRTYVERPRSADVDAVLEQIRAHKPESYLAAVFWDPRHSSFELLDFFAAYYAEEGKPPEVCAYQMKAGKSYPKDPPRENVRCFVVRGADVGVEKSNAAGKGWIVVPPDFRGKLLGPTFTPLLDFEYGEVGGKKQFPTASTPSPSTSAPKRHPHDTQQRPRRHPLRHFRLPLRLRTTSEKRRSEPSSLESSCLQCNLASSPIFFPLPPSIPR